MTLGATPIRNSIDILMALDLEEQDRVPSEQPATNTQTPVSNQTDAAILSALREPLSKDQLLQHLGLPIQEVNIALTKLELLGKVKSEHGILRAVNVI
jgi:predicted Rossmann fold nucleotide-binding protein DprA/Smf involved in DNA uptake